MSDNKQENPKQPRVLPKGSGGLSLNNAPSRSILKQRSSYEDGERENMTMSNIQLPTNSLTKEEISEGNNTTSIINTSSLQSKLNRRVSFAPDVTLHRFDFIPEPPTTFREPRRRNTDVEKNVIASPEKESVNNLNQFEITNEEQEHVSEQRQEFEQESEHEQEDDRENSTMEFTNPISTIFQQQEKKEIPEKQQLSSPYQPVFDKEVSMEITQLFSKHSAKPEVETNISSQGEESMELTTVSSHVEPIEPHKDERGDTMDFTGIPAAMKPPAMNNQRARNAGNQNNRFDTTNDESMEMTTPFNKKVDKHEETMDLTGLPSIKSSEHDVESVDLTMRKTGNPMKENQNLTHNLQEGETMDFTSIQSKSAGKEELEFRPSQMITSTQQTSFGNVNPKRTPTPSPITESKKQHRTPRSHTLDTGSPKQLQPKRRKLNDESFLSPIAMRSSGANSSTNQQSEEDLELSLMEKLSPIKINSTTAPNALKMANLTPTKIDFNKKTDSPQIITSPAPPLKDSSVGKKSSKKQEVEESLEPIPLKKFLKATGISFFIDVNIAENQNPIKFEYVDNQRTLSTEEVYNSLYANIPILEIYAFCCKELNRRIRESKKLFDELEEQISSTAPPLLLRDYFESSEEVRRLMNDQIQLVKSYSRLEAKKVWLEWRSQHLKGIKNALCENLSLLEEEYRTVVKSMKDSHRINEQAKNIRQTLKKEIQLLQQASRNEDDIPTLLDRLKIERLKDKLKRNMIEVGEIARLNSKKEEIVSKMEELNLKITKVKTQISSLSTDIKNNRIYTKYDLKKFQNNFRILQRISKIEFVKLVGSKLTLGIGQPGIKITINLSDVENMGNVDTEVSAEVSPLKKYWYGKVIKNAKQLSSDSFDYVSRIVQQSNEMKNLDKEYERLQLVFPTRIVIDANNLASLEIRDYDPVLKFKVFYYISVDDFILATENQASNSFLTKLHAKVIYGTGLTDESLQKHLRTKADKLIPWFKGCRITL